MRPRLRAGLLHLTLSGLVGLGALALVFLVWYPAPLDAAVGVRDIVVVLLGVDVVIGPLLTFVVYRAHKKSLKFDLAVIAILQASAFLYGMRTIADGRPVWLVFNADRFDVVRANELDERYERPSAYRDAPWFGPQWVASANPADPEKLSALVLESAMGGADLAQRPDLYVPLSSLRKQLLVKAQPLAKLAEFNPPDALSKATARWPGANAWLPLMSRIKPMVVLIDQGRAEPIAVVDLHPWRE
jgi:hypothetical protein